MERKRLFIRVSREVIRIARVWGRVLLRYFVANCRICQGGSRLEVLKTGFTESHMFRLVREKR